MPDKSYPYLDVLKEFVYDNDLSTNNSNIRFKSNCNFKTPRRHTNVDSDVIIAFDNYNRECIIIILKDFDQNFYPTIFLATSQNIAIDEGALIISGAFPNKKLGRYKVSITPLRKV